MSVSGTKVVVFLGPPGVGKGTQAGLLAERTGASHVSTGALLRDEIASGSELGLKVQGIIHRGDLVSDDDLFACLESGLVRALARKTALVILDGVPRNRSQVPRLDEALEHHGLRVEAALYFGAPVEKLIERFAKRWSCSACGAVYALDVAPVKEASCARCAGVGTLYRREDDGAAAVQHRFSVYERETAPLLSDYRARGLLSEISGLGTGDEVFQAMSGVIEKIL
jgi:adenylate kinase